MKGRRPADLRGSGIVGATVDVTVFRKMSSNHRRLATKIPPDCCSFSLLSVLCEMSVKIIQ